jgi:heavy metal translocating P-type ATPase
MPRGRTARTVGAMRRLREDPYVATTAVALGALCAGGALLLAGHDTAAHSVLGAAVAVLLVPLTLDVARTLIRDRRAGADVIALLAMAGALALGQWAAGAVIALMFSGGRVLEGVAGRRARRELTALIRGAPKIAHVRSAGRIDEVPVDDVHPGDVVVQRTGELVPVDGVVLDGDALLDESTVTGESLPVTRAAGEAVLSGTTNIGPPFELRAQRPAAASAYATVVRMVEAAEHARAPFVRLADRYAMIFLPVTLLVAGAAWALSGDPVRALAVLVVATPCPLILAAPIALVAGVSRAARRGVIVKGAPVIEALGRARTVLFDKTGTLTAGRPAVVAIAPARRTDSRDELLRLAASLDQLSPHPLAEALVHGAERHGLELAVPSGVREEPGRSITGTVDGRAVEVGSPAWVNGGADMSDDGAPGLARIAVVIDGQPAGTITLADELRPDAARLVDRLRGQGIRHVALASGDERAVADRIGAMLGVDRVYADLGPADKVDVVAALHDDARLAPVVMVGDGVNDAPALARADVGIAMGAAGATAAAEAADAVIVVDAIERVADALALGRRSLRIATQSVVAGMALSAVAMGFAAAGRVAPVAGALLQEAIDLAVVLNALRALR